MHVLLTGDTGGDPRGSTSLLLPFPGCFCPVTGPAGGRGRGRRTQDTEEEPADGAALGGGGGHLGAQARTRPGHWTPGPDFRGFGCTTLLSLKGNPGCPSPCRGPPSWLPARPSVPQRSSAPGQPPPRSRDQIPRPPRGDSSWRERRWQTELRLTATSSEERPESVPGRTPGAQPSLLMQTPREKVQPCSRVVCHVSKPSLCTCYLVADDHGPVATEPRRPWKQMQFTQSAHFPSQTGSAVRPRLDRPGQQLSRPYPLRVSQTHRVLFLFVSCLCLSLGSWTHEGRGALCSVPVGAPVSRSGAVPGERRNLCPWC
ncbi:uncharacterized protein LOC111179508 isoform X2 [Delphinapterus leucas]|uniref:Uncharacterized protein LOC111179508 isoform X2 n=1 Tax=Delphinapterus leucas TaxID=9749 RepID=A0A2Y9P979_DELLE|nr:uncharacterized protein LOC111179508 isoform X2 [Delphinapterus leucas]